MRRFNSKLFLFLLVMISGRAIAQEIFDPQYLEKIILQEQKSGRSKIFFRESAITDDYDLNYMRAWWEIDPAVYYIKGALSYYFHPVNTAITAISFDLSDSLLFTYFVYHGDTSYNFTRPGNNIVECQFPQSIASAQQDSITLCYEGKPASTAFGSFEQETHNDQPIIWTLSEPYGASDWFVCKNSLADKIDSIDIFIKTPTNYHAGTAGILMSETPVSGSNDKIIHWRHRYPIATYLIGVAVTNYAIIHQNAALSSGKNVPVLQYLYPEDSAAYMNDTTLIVKFLQLFSNLFGDYPFADEKYGHAQWNWGGGEEHQTMSFVVNAGSFELIAHELAHQWFGDKVTCGSWTDIWLNEGFATYLSGLSYENIGPLYWMPFKITQRDRALKDSTGSVFCDDTTDVSRIFNSSLSYSKGAYLLHMLRWKMGDEIFFNAVSAYVNDPDLCYGFARTADLQQHLESVSGQDLDEFFEDWFYGKGYPTYYFKWANLPDGKVNIAIHQTQNHPSVSFYEMPVPIRLKDETHDTTIVIQNNANDLTYLTGPFSFLPDSIFFDPELWLLAKSKPPVYDPLLSDLLTIFPNPATDAITISYHSNEDALQQITLYDISGKRMKELFTASTGSYNPVTLDISNLSGGYYFLEIITTANKYVERIVKF
ncbi:MAG: M1 family aminopeptidase [Chitinophagales bacterium]